MMPQRVDTIKLQIGSFVFCVSLQQTQQAESILSFLHLQYPSYGPCHFSDVSL